MGGHVTVGRENIPDRPIVVIPNRLDLRAVKALVEDLGGPERVSWLVEASLKPDAEVLQYAATCGSAGSYCAVGRQNAEMLAPQVRRFLESRQHVVLLVGHPMQAPGTLSDVPGELLRLIVDMGFPCMPVYVGMVSNRPWTPSTVTSGVYDRLELHYGHPLRTTTLTTAHVLSAWMEAQSAVYEKLPLLDHSLAHAIVSAMQRHADAVVIDGVDDTQLSNRNVLPLALMFAQYLQGCVKSGRVGVILPPGKLAVITYVACLLSGITPVSIDYNATAEDVRHMVRQAGLTRFITEERFVSKMNRFCWPRQRDLIYAERELAEMGGARLRMWEFLVRYCSPERLLNWIKSKPSKPEDEAMITFTGGTDYVPKGVSLTHRMLLTALAQMVARFDMKPGEKLLSLMPYGHPMPLVTGLLLPLLGGYSVVTYPTEDSGRRICELIHNYAVVMAVSRPRSMERILNAAQPETFKSMRYYLSVGEKLPAPLRELAIHQFGLHILEAYTLEELVPMVASALPPLSLPAGVRHSKPTGPVGSVGEPLPGVAVRIADPDRADKLVACGSLGMVWLKSPALATHYLSEEHNKGCHVHNGWFRTDDIGTMTDDGMLTLCGRRTRFSKVGDVLQAHEELEQALLRVLKADPTKSGRKLAVVGVKEAKGREKLVLLSTLHRVVAASDYIAMQYGLKNAGYRHMCPPEIILPVTYIPELPNGKLDYKRCHDAACKALSLRPS